MPEVEVFKQYFQYKQLLKKFHISVIFIKKKNRTTRWSGQDNKNENRI